MSDFDFTLKLSIDLFYICPLLFLSVSMAAPLLTEEDRANIKLIAEELPKLRHLVEELVETLDVLGNEDELKAIEESLEQVRRGELRDWDSYVKSLREKGAI